MSTCPTLLLDAPTRRGERGKCMTGFHIDIKMYDRPNGQRGETRHGQGRSPDTKGRHKETARPSTQTPDLAHEVTRVHNYPTPTDESGLDGRPSRAGESHPRRLLSCCRSVRSWLESAAPSLVPRCSGDIRDGLSSQPWNEIVKGNRRWLVLGRAASGGEDTQRW